MLESIGITFEIIGVAVVIMSQILFWNRSKDYGGMKKAFFAWLSCMRLPRPDLNIEKANGIENLRNTPEKEISDRFPEWWELSKYLQEDVVVSAIGLGITLIGLILELLAPILLNVIQKI